LPRYLWGDTCRKNKNKQRAEKQGHQQSIPRERRRLLFLHSSPLYKPATMASMLLPEAGKETEKEIWRKGEMVSFEVPFSCMHQEATGLEDK